MKKFNHFLQYFFINIFFFIFKILGFKISSDLGNIIGKYLGPIFRSKKLIINNLEKAGINFIEVGHGLGLGAYRKGGIYEYKYKEINEYPYDCWTNRCFCNMGDFNRSDSGDK